MRRICALALCIGLSPSLAAQSTGLTVSPNETLEMQGLTVLVHQMQFHPVFRDEKNAGIQLILHGNRIATDGEVRLNPTPEQWDPVPAVVERTHTKNTVTVRSGYKEFDLFYRLVVTPEGNGFKVTVHLDKPLAQNLVGKAGFNLDFIPTAYFGKSYIMGEAPGLFPRNPGGPMQKNGSGDPEPLAQGAHQIVLSPEDPLTRVTITSDVPLMLLDARNRAQNGWFVVRALIPAGKTENALVWHVRPNVIKGWTRKPNIGFNQAGYTPGRNKVAIIELDPKFKAPAMASVVRLGADGKAKPVFTAKTVKWGKWTRYNYAKFDFSAVKTPGVYAISYGGQTTNPFRIAADAYDHIWQPTLDTYLPVQMDHVTVREEYRIWHGPAHLDDARQAAPNTKHFDGYEMGPDIASPFKPGDHIPGLNVGGWFDAGDFDIQTPSQSFVVRDLVAARENFGLAWDETTVNEDARTVEIRKPDGVSDALQQIRHGTMQILAQYKAFGHTISGLIDPTLRQYTHLGDGASQTDRLIYDPALGPNDIKGGYSGIADDRLAFTQKDPGVDFISVSGLAAASRALGEIDPAMAAEALAAAKSLWALEEKNLADGTEKYQQTWFGGKTEMGEITATVELVIATKGADPYAARLKALMPKIKESFLFTAGTVARAVPFMDAEYRAQLAEMVKAALPIMEKELAKTPYGVPIGLRTWAGAHEAAAFGSAMYFLHKAFPELVGTQQTIDTLDYLLGRHPATNVSLVSTIGTQSKLIAYGGNRADYSFIPGAMVPGVLVIKPDFPEQKLDWPFLWYENETVVGTATAYLLEANAAIAALKE